MRDHFPWPLACPGMAPLFVSVTHSGAMPLMSRLRLTPVLSTPSSSPLVIAPVPPSTAGLQADAQTRTPRGGNGGMVFRRAAFLSWFPLGTRPLHNGVFSVNTPFFSGHGLQPWVPCLRQGTAIRFRIASMACVIEACHSALGCGSRHSARRLAFSATGLIMASGGTVSKSAPPGIAVRHPSSSPGQRHKQGSGQAPVIGVGSQGSGQHRRGVGGSVRGHALLGWLE